MSLGSRTTAPDAQIEAALASNWICVPFGDPKSKHDSNLPRKLARRCVAAEEALRQVRLASLLRIRQAAFAPEIGVRYTEKIRAAIAAECFALERFIDSALAAVPGEDE